MGSSAPPGLRALWTRVPGARAPGYDLSPLRGWGNPVDAVVPSGGDPVGAAVPSEGGRSVGAVVPSEGDPLAPRCPPRAGDPLVRWCPPRAIRWRGVALRG